MQAVLIPGDGIGREISASVQPVCEALGVNIDWTVYEAGAEYAKQHGELLQPGLLDAISSCKWALKGPTATPIGKGFRSINDARLGTDAVVIIGCTHVVSIYR